MGISLPDCSEKTMRAFVLACIAVAAVSADADADAYTIAQVNAGIPALKTAYDGPDTSPVSAMETVSSPDILAMLVMAMLLTPTPPMEPLMPPLSTTSTRERLRLMLMPTPSVR